MIRSTLAVIVICYVLLPVIAYADSITVTEAETLRAGAGFGIEYGIIGAKVEYLPAKYLGIFAGLENNGVYHRIYAGDRTTTKT